MEDRERRMLQDLHYAVGVFREYEKLHLAKNTVESAVKAAVNAHHAQRLETTIKQVNLEVQNEHL